MKTIPHSYKTIWQTVKQIPKGKVATYGQVAELADLKGQARLVGYALHNLPEKSKIPWYRVINSKGKISFPNSSKTFKLQRRLLVKESIVFLSDKIDLEKYGWLYNIQKQWKAI
jgi:methylated-DNA-protein-cysteine methyltransferase-like protein